MKHQTKSITTIDDYKFTLSDELRSFTERECRETDEVRQHGIEAIREWALRNPRIVKTRLDSNFLLRFLRAKKFSLPMVQENFERYMVLRWYEEQGVHIFRNLDYKLPVIKELFDSGYIFALPQRDVLGRRVIMYRLGMFNPSKHCNHDMVKTHAIVYETLLEDEVNQINGIVHIVDSSGIGFNFLTIFTPHEAYRIGKNLEIILPMRHKAIHGLKVHPSIKFAVDFALSQMSEKMRKRVFLYKKVDDIKNIIDKDLLPLEYGGKIPMSEMISAFQKELEEKRDILLTNDEMELKLDLYPRAIREGSTRALKSNIDTFEDWSGMKKECYGVQGSFRKLEID